jgi:hypothetical protein
MENLQCPECEEDRTFGTKGNLKRHLRQNHAISGDRLETMMSAIPNVLTWCDVCKFEVNNIAKHRTTKKHLRNKKKAKEPALTFNDDNDDIDDSDENDAENEEIPSDETFMDEFVQFCKNSGGGLKERTTIKNYRLKILAFKRHMKAEHSKFQLGLLINVTSKDKFMKLPSGINWITSYEGDRSKCQASNAYKKLAQFICFKISSKEHLMKDNVATQRYNYLNRRKDEASNLDKQYSRHIDMKAAQKRRDEIHMAKSDSERRISHKELKELCDLYRECDFRKETYDVLQTKMEDTLRRNVMTAVEIRNFVMWEMYFESGGLRPEVILNMTIKDFANFDKPEVEIDQEFRTIVVSDHKTSESGAANVHLPKATYQIARKYKKLVRPSFVRESDEDPEKALLFLTERGSHVQSFTEPTNMFKKATNCKYKMQAYDLRRYIATLGQQSSDPRVNEKFPVHMNHQPSTARRYYEHVGEKMNEHLKMKIQLLGHSKDLPEDKEDNEDSEDDEINKINRNIKRKRKEEALEQRKRSFTRHAHRHFDPDEVEVIKSAFAFAVKGDGSPIGNISECQVAEAVQDNQEFRKLFNRHVEERNIEPADLAKQVMNSYRWHCVRKLQKGNNENPVDEDSD